MEQITASRVNTVLLIVLMLVLAIFAFRSQRTAHAQNAGIQVLVEEVPIVRITNDEVIPRLPPGMQVVGFSCVIEDLDTPAPERAKQLLGKLRVPKCFIASAPR